jgi:regulator of chromosome condensation
LGFSVDSNIQQTPILIKGLKNIVDVACGNDHALALGKNGKVWAWGTSQQDQLGRLGLVLGRDRTKGLIPQKIELSRKKVKSIHSGSFHSFAVTTDGSVYSWGLNSFGQCGFYVVPKDDSTTSLVSVPTRAPALQDQDIVMLDGGDKHSIALTSDGDLLAWGNMTAHQVGVGFEKVPSESVVLDESGKPRCLIVPSKISDKKLSQLVWQLAEARKTARAEGLSCGPKVEVVEFVGGRLRWLRVRGGRAGVEDELRAARPRRGEERGG